MGKSDTNHANLTLPIPPVVTVLGHVDHGKTTLLDAIRSSSIADREFGGITQKIGASRVEIMHDGVKRPITFIDTPGHLAFSQMRSKGAQVADIGLLIVSAVDGVMPQTRESIQILKAAKIPYIVVLTKVDLPTAQIDKTKQELLREEILLEGMGGDVPVIEVSAKTGKNVKQLLDLIILVFDLHKDASASDPRTLPFMATVIESKLDSKSGPRATIVVKQGSVSVRDTIYYDTEEFRVRTLMNDLGKPEQTAGVGMAVEILGLTKVPPVGSIMLDAKSTDAPRPVAQATLAKELVYMRPTEEDEGLAVVLCADTQGSLDAITGSLPKEVKIIASKTGEVSEADILLAKSTGAIVLSFNSRIRPDIAKLAMTEKILAKNYQIIYEMLDEIRDVLEGKKLARIEEIYGTAKVLGKFPFEKTFAIGLQVIEGRVARGDKIRIVRGDEVIGEATLTSLRVGKNPVSKVERGEAGGIISPTLDFQIGDMIICHA